MVGGEVYVKKIPSMKVVDIAKTINSKATHNLIGIRPGEKLHEEMISGDDASSTYEYSDYYKILPQIYEWVKDEILLVKGVYEYVHWLIEDEPVKEIMLSLESGASNTISINDVKS